MQNVTLFSEDFSSFDLGGFPYDPEHSAMGEYHYYPAQGYKGFWYDPIVNWNYTGPSWIVTNPRLDGVNVMELSRIQEPKERDVLPTLTAGDRDWKDYQLKVALRPLSRELFSGVLVRYQTSLRHYGVFFTDDGIEVHKVDLTERTVLAKASAPWLTDEFQDLIVSVHGNTITVTLNGEWLLEVFDDWYDRGAIALSGCMPTQYAHVEVMTSEKEALRLEEERIEKRRKLAQKRANQPKLAVAKKIDLQDFGSGRQIRFGHLTGTKEYFFVMAQSQRRVYKDRYPMISCLTAVSLESGNVLWQLGKPRTDDGVIKLTTDLPFQVYDIDGDGIDEVIASWDFTLYILDGRDGSVKRRIPTPYNVEPVEELDGIEFGHHAFDRLNVDAIRIVNVTGKVRPSDILIKDRYARLWVFDDELNLIWKFHHNNTGHFPYARDFNNDGKDEIFSCYNMIDSEGKLMCKLPIDSDHTDEIIVGPIDPDQEDLIAIVSGWEGFILLKPDGTILKRTINGHGQRISVGNYIPENRGLEICTTTYWGAQGILYMHTCKGEEIWSKEMRSNGALITPVNWDGSGRDLLLIHSGVEHGGLMDGDGDIVVTFPDDGHPELCCEVLNILGDSRDEIIVWDQKELWVYTQDREQPEREYSYHPVKYSTYNASNYRGEYSFPRWE
ncbi:MAG: hypothetical protein EWM48_03445 [Sphaerochaeta sp.]|nr:MAG: hypothetical protein EWM48_03445 [Sphaerochaeta sp.]